MKCAHSAKPRSGLNAGDLDAFMALMDGDVQFTSMVAEAEGATFQGA